MDEFKKYMQQQAGEHFPDEPGEQVWENIRRNLIVASPAQVKRLPFLKMAAIAACFIGLVGFATWWVMRGETGTIKDKGSVAVSGKQPVATPQQEQSEAIKDADAPIADAEVAVPKKTRVRGRQESRSAVPSGTETSGTPQESAFLQNLESSFTQVINLQKDKLSQTPMYAESPEYFRDFKVQFNQMNKDEQGIRKDITRLGLSQELLDQLINVYQQKLNLLKQLQLEMTKTNNRFQQHARPVDSLNMYFIHL